MCAWRLAAHASALGGCPALGQHVIAHHMSPPARVVYTMGHVASGPWSITAKHWGLGFAPRATTTICVAWGKSLPLLPRFAYLESGDDHRQLDVGRLEECTQCSASVWDGFGMRDKDLSRAHTLCGPGTFGKCRGWNALLLSIPRPPPRAVAPASSGSEQAVSERGFWELGGSHVLQPQSSSEIKRKQPESGF